MVSQLRKWDSSLTIDDHERILEGGSCAKKFAIKSFYEVNKDI